jgi:flagellar protein FlgJ
MDKKEFVKKYLPEAQKASDIILQKYGKKVFVGTILVRAAIESGWGEKAPQNNFFGIKDFDGVNGNEFLLTTTEFHKTRNVKYPKILSIIKKEDNEFKIDIITQKLTDILLISII